jgi:hypothetical protein
VKWFEPAHREREDWEHVRFVSLWDIKQGPVSNNSHPEKVSTATSEGVLNVDINCPNLC